MEPFPSVFMRGAGLEKDKVRLSATARACCPFPAPDNRAFIRRHSHASDPLPWGSRGGGRPGRTKIRGLSLDGAQRTSSGQGHCGRVEDCHRVLRDTLGGVAIHQFCESHHLSFENRNASPRGQPFKLGSFWTLGQTPQQTIGARGLTRA